MFFFFHSVFHGMCLKTHNVKLHFKTEKSVFKSRKSLKRTYKNFCVEKISHFVFTIFTSGHVNATGIKSFDEVNEAVSCFCEKFDVCYKDCVKSLKIDNSTSSAYISSPEKIYLPDLTKHLEEGTLSLRPEFFPGAVLRRDKKCTVVIFSTGRFIIIGAKSKEEAQDANNAICLLISRYHQVSPLSVLT